MPSLAPARRRTTRVRVSIMLGLTVAAGCTDIMGGTSTVPGALARRLWRTPVDFGPVGWSGSPAAGNGHVYVVTATGLAALQQSTGAVTWEQQYGPPGVPAAANLVLSGSQVVVPAEGGVFAVAAATGALQWTHVGDSLTARAQLSGDATTIYAGTRDRRLLALDLASGHTRWTADIGRGWPHGGLSLGSSARGDTVYAIAVRYLSANSYLRAGVVVALDRRTGAELWRYQSDTTQRHDVDASPVIAGSRLVVVDPEGHAFFALDRNTGREVWRVATAAAYVGPTGAPVVVGDTVFVGSNDRMLYAADLESGRLLWSARADVSIAHVAPCGRSVLVVNQGLTIVDRFLRRALQTILASDQDFATSGVATDGGRAFVASLRAVQAFDCVEP